MANQESLFSVVDAPKRGRKATGIEIDPQELERVALFHKFILQSRTGQANYKNLDGVEHFTRDKALATSARLKAAASQAGVDLGTCAEPNGQRMDDGTPIYVVRGWKRRERAPKAASVRL